MAWFTTDWFSSHHTVKCTHKSGDVINFIIVVCRISSRLKWYENYKNRLRLAKVVVKNKMSRFLWFSVYIHIHIHTIYSNKIQSKATMIKDNTAEGQPSRKMALMATHTWYTTQKFTQKITKIILCYQTFEGALWLSITRSFR